MLNATGNMLGASVWGLPEDQWTRDVRGFENIVLADIQLLAAQRSVGYPGVGGGVLNEPTTPAGKWLCQAQKVVKSGGFANINVFGLAFTLSMAALLLLLDLGILRGIILLDKVKHRLSPGVQYWIDDGVFQLQSAAYQARGMGTWTRLDKEVPKTSPGDTLPPLPARKSSPSTTPSIANTSTALQSQQSAASSNASIAPATAGSSAVPSTPTGQPAIATNSIVPPTNVTLVGGASISNVPTSATTSSNTLGGAASSGSPVPTGTSVQTTSASATVLNQTNIAAATSTSTSTVP